MEKEILKNLDLSVLDGLSETQKQAALQILQEYADKGSSKAYEDMLMEDYNEAPVDIDTFLHDPTYLGKGLVNDEGKFTVFPYWVEMLHKLFPDNVSTAYNTLVLSGAIGLGKSFIAVIAMLYLLYRMLCLKDPYKYFGLQPIDHITFSLMNITLGAAKGVAWSKIQELLQLSPWFMAHGRLSRSINPEWQPDSNIELIYGSQPRHVIGRAVFCLSGDTEILTDKGLEKLENLVGSSLHTYSYGPNQQITISDSCTVQPTVKTDTEYRISLEDGSVICCTPEHRFLLKDGTYKRAKDLSEVDELSSLRQPFGYIYKTTNKLNGKIYIGKREKSHFDNSYYGSGTYLHAALKKYGKENFSREILQYAFSREELLDLEQQYVDFWDATNHEIGYNLKRGGLQGSSGAHHTDEWKKAHSGPGNGRYHKEVSQETRNKISSANKGRGRGIPNPKKGRPGQAKPEGFGEKISRMQRGKTLSPITRQKLSERTANKRWITDGLVNKKIDRGLAIPEGFWCGQTVTEERKQTLRELLKQRGPQYGQKNGNYGNHWSAEQRQQMSVLKKQWLSTHENPHNKAVRCIETGQIYTSIKDAQIATGLKTISACISGRTQTAGGLHWEVYYENS